MTSADRTAISLTLAGLALTLLGGSLMVVGATRETNVSVGGVVFVGPIPIAFGYGPQGPILVLVSAILLLAMALVFVSLFLRRRKAEGTEA